MKVRTLAELEAQLDVAFSFAKKELFSIKRQLVGRDNQFAARSAVVLAYAHWEGCIKHAFWSVIEFLTHKRMQLDKLAECYSLLAICGTINRNPQNDVHAAFLTGKSLSGMPQRRISARMFPEDKRVGNLNWDLFALYAPCICVDANSLVSKKVFIDTKLVPYRHIVAHGKRLDAGFDTSNQGINSYCDEIIAILDSLRTEISNGIAQKKYER